MYLINLSCALCHFVHSCRPQHFPGPGMVARQGQCGRRHQNSKRHLQCTFGEHLNGSEWSPEWSSEWSPECPECPECPEWSKYVNVLARPFFSPVTSPDSPGIYLKVELIWKNTTENGEPNNQIARAEAHLDGLSCISMHKYA